MNSLASIWSNALKLHQAGMVEQALREYQKVLEQDGNHTGARHFQGVCLHQLGRHQEAIANIEHAIRLDPRRPEYHNNLGAALQALGRWQEAIESYGRAVTLQPKYADAHGNLGAALEQLGRLPEAEPHLREAARINPRNFEVVVRLARLLVQLGRSRDALGYLKTARELRPDDMSICRELADCRLATGRPQDAERGYRAILSRDPDNAIVQFNLGNALNDQDRVDEAREEFRRASKLAPASKGPAWLIRTLAICPAAFGSVEQLDKYREELDRQLDDLLDRTVTIEVDDLLQIGFTPPFALAFHGRCNRAIKEKFAALCRKWIRPLPTSPRRGKPRVGFVVTRGHEGIFLRCTGGIVKRLCPRKLEVLLICPESLIGQLRASIGRPDLQFVAIPDRLTEAARRIAETACDLLYYWEVGSDPLNYLLPFFRLAPLQVTSWGTQVTSGISEIDYYLSSDLIEHSDAERNYTEKLVRFSDLLTFQQRIPSPATTTKDFFGLSNHHTVYLCPQAVLKLHPEQDSLFTAILRRDPNGIVVLKSGRQPRTMEVIRERLKRTASDVVDRIVCLPWQSRADYYRLISIADVVLDALHFSAGSSSYDMWSLNQPIVALPNQFNVGRYTQACYRKMNWVTLVANSPEEYVTAASELGRDSEYRHEMKRKLALSSDSLFEQLSSVNELEEFLLRTIEFERARPR